MRFLLLIFFCPVIVTAQINAAYIFKADLNYTKLIAAGEGLFGFEKDGKIGYIDKNEKIIWVSLDETDEIEWDRQLQE